MKIVLPLLLKMTKQSIWDMAIAHQAEKHQNSSSTTLSAQHKETTLLFVGSRNVGKTTLIHRFLERQETSKPTLALEYTFGRKTNQNLAKVEESHYFFSSFMGIIYS